MVLVDRLINGDVHLLEEDAVSGDFVASVHRNNIADDELSDLDSPGFASSAVDLNFLVADLGLQFEPLLIFGPIAEGLDDCCEEKAEEDHKALNKSRVTIAEEAKEEVEGCRPNQVDRVDIFELTRELGPEEVLDQRQSDFVLTEYLVTPSEVSIVSDDASVDAGVEKPRKPLDVVYRLQNGE
jgi:hypothetical protein